MSARRAFEIGLVSEVVPAADLITTATRLAGEIASQPPLAVQTSVRALWAARELSRQQMLGVSNAFLAIGTRPDALAAGQVAFTSSTRVSPRVR
jgi:enoyl-CoA hydratase/carnithine racemase